MGVVAWRGAIPDAVARSCFLRCIVPGRGCCYNALPCGPGHCDICGANIGQVYLHGQSACSSKQLSAINGSVGCTYEAACNGGNTVLPLQKYSNKLQHKAFCNMTRYLAGIQATAHVCKSWIIERQLC